MAIHVATVKPTLIDGVGNIVNRNDSETTISSIAASNSEMRIVPNKKIPSSLNSPNVEDYLIAEDAAGFSLKHIDNNLIITQS